MSQPITLYGFETSNNMKVRVALGFKGIAYEFKTIDPGERDEIMRLSGQSLTPMLVHGDVVLSDSGAILRYLDANFLDTPRLFGSSREEQWAIEDWELFGRGELAQPMMTVVHTRISGGEISEELERSCQAEFSRALTKLTARLGDHDWLHGDSMTAADITVAPVLFRIRAANFFEFPAGNKVLDNYVERVMAFDRPAQN